MPLRATWRSTNGAGATPCAADFATQVCGLLLRYGAQFLHLLLVAPAVQRGRGLRANVNSPVAAWSGRHGFDRAQSGGLHTDRAWGAFGVRLTAPGAVNCTPTMRGSSSVCIDRARSSELHSRVRYLCVGVHLASLSRHSAALRAAPRLISRNGTWLWCHRRTSPQASVFYLCMDGCIAEGVDTRPCQT
jgi:hypothetical protein